MRQPLTNEQVDEYLKSKSIKRLSNYKDNKSKLDNDLIPRLYFNQVK